LDIIYMIYLKCLNKINFVAGTLEKNALSCVCVCVCVVFHLLYVFKIWGCKLS